MSECEDLDYALALSLQEQFAREQKHEGEKLTRTESVTELRDRYDPKLIVDERWELLDPHPNVHDLFVQFDAMFFERRLVNAGVEVRWSPRMTLCAGVCSYEGRGGLCSVRLSVPLLKLRPRKDLVETLLHEMIHALLFVTENNTDHDGHGPNFCSHMKRINNFTGANITIYHTFHQEVSQYRQHWWRCDGPCRNRPPFYGWVKRAMNRAPSSRDRWWNEHQLSCGGSYSKVKEPEGYGEKKKKKIRVGVKMESATGKSSGETGTLDGRASGCKDIKEMMKRNDRGTTSKSDSSAQGVGKPQVPHNSKGSKSKVFGGQGHTLLASGAGMSKEPTSQSERRQKLLEAVEKRRQMAQTKGVKRKTTEKSYDIRTFCTTPHRGKVPKLDPSTLPHNPTNNTTASFTHGTTNSASPCEEATCSPSTSRSLSTESENSHCGVVDLVNEGRCVGDEDQIVVIDDDPELESGDMPVAFQSMCPVCGRTDIPPDLINLHVAYCLED